MINGLIYMKWDERVGVKILETYPEGINLQEDTLMQLYGQHEFTGKEGFTTLASGTINVASYYSGPDFSTYLILVLPFDEDAEVYEEGLVEAGQRLNPHMKKDVLQSLIPGMFQRLTIYPTLTEEQRMGLLYHNQLKRMVLNRLREEVMISKSEIGVWLRDQYTEGIVDVDALVTSLVKTGLVKILSVKGYASDMIYLIRDVMISRIPPADIVKNPTGRHLPPSFKSSYLKDMRSFFENYTISEQDNLKMIEDILLEPAHFELLKLLRTAAVTRNDIEKLKKKGLDDPDGALKVFWENKMISVFKDDSGMEYFALSTDLGITKYFPRYLLDLLRKQYKSKSQNPTAIIQGLDLLKEEYGLFLVPAPSN